ncbi:MAG: transketolase [Thermodesulfobacteriota bacterium]
MEQNKLDDLCINTIRMLAVDAVEAANSGHPGMPMEAANLAYVLWTQFLKHNPTNPHWPNRDRFVLSAGHGSMLLYAMLHLTGYDLSLDEIKNFRQWESKTPGHPEYKHVPGVETTTGPLGQGFATGVGMAVAEWYLAQKFNQPDFPLVDYNIYALVSDGDIMEGISSEAASIAGHLGLGKLVYIYLDNRITIDGSTDLAFTEDVSKRFEAYKWHVQKVDGYDIKGISEAIKSAKAESGQPSLVIARTHIGYGSPNKQDKESAHGSPLGTEEVRLVKENFKWPLEPSFYIPDEALVHFRKSLEEGKEQEQKWKTFFKNYAEKHPELANKWHMLNEKNLPDGWEKEIPDFNVSSGPMATRSASGKVINAVSPKLLGLIGGSADLAGSNNTLVKESGSFKIDPDGKNIFFGVREHAMAGILNGLALSNGLLPYGGTFLVFSDYMRGSIRLAAMMGLQVMYVFTHDSIGVGEDGPTHQPIEQIAGLRAVPNLTVIRPADAAETAVAWKAFINQKNGPVALILTRQKLPVLDRGKFPSAENLLKGAYVLADPPDGGNPDIILLATGSEVHPAIEAYDKLTAEGLAVRVVNMPSWELFEKQTNTYKDHVLPPSIPARLAIEAASPQGWHRYVGLEGDVIGMTGFGASAPGPTLFEKFGFTVDNIATKAKSLLSGILSIQAAVNK